MIGTLIGRYQITEKLGEGGMGVVYKATDVSLGRSVAIKFLPPGIEGDGEEVRRLEHEARALSALNSPNVATIYAIEEHQGKKFIVMEYLEGGTLSELLKKVRPSLEQFLDYALQIGRGLDHAHQHGVIHRDLKTSNIMLARDGSLKITDFGVAKLRGVTRLTRTGTTVGTAAYMSPEQARGEEVDQRSDIFSLGIILYELLTGQLPFRGVHEAALLYEITHEEPAPLTSLRPDLPAEIGEVIARALRKKPSDRHQGVGELVEALKSIGTGHPSRDRSAKARRSRLKVRLIAVSSIGLLSLAIGFWPSSIPEDAGVEPATAGAIAILPFRQLRPDSLTDFLGVALAEEITTKLSRIPGLSVRPAGVVRKYEESRSSPGEIGRELKVTALLAGSYLRDGSRLRVNAQLIDVSSNHILWGEPLDFDYGDLFLVQDSLSKVVTGRLKVDMSPQERRAFNKNVPADPLAYEYYLRGLTKPFWPGEELHLRASMLEKAIELDSSFAPAYDMLTSPYYNLAYQYNLPGYIEKTERMAVGALARDSGSTNARRILAILKAEQGEVEFAIDLLLERFAFEPEGYNFIPDGLAGIFERAGLYDGVRAIWRGLMIHDTTIATRLHVMRSEANLLTFEGRYKEARRTIDTIEAIAAGSGRRGFNGFSAFHNGLIHLYNGETDRAFGQFDSIVAAQRGYNLYALYGQAYKEAYRRNKPAALEIVRLVESEGKVDGLRSYRFAQFHALIGDTAGALRNLERAAALEYVNHPYWATDRFLDHVRGTPGFQRLLRHVESRHLYFKKKYGGRTY